MTFHWASCVSYLIWAFHSLNTGPAKEAKVRISNSMILYPPLKGGCVMLLIFFFYFSFKWFSRLLFFCPNFSDYGLTSPICLKSLTRSLLPHHRIVSFSHVRSYSPHFLCTVNFIITLAQWKCSAVTAHKPHKPFCHLSFWMFPSDDAKHCPATDHLPFTTFQDALQNNILPQYRLNNFHHQMVKSL